MFKKTFYLLLLCLLYGSYSQAQRPMIFTLDVQTITNINPWEVNSPEKFAYSWEKINNPSLSGTRTSNYDSPPFYKDTFNFPDTGVYRIQIWNASTTPLSDLNFFTDGLILPTVKTYRLKELEQWGDIQWQAFPKFLFTRYTTGKHINTDTPDFSRITDMARALEDCPLDSIPNIEYWDVSKVENMNSLFRNYQNFNQNLNNWDVRSVTDLRLIFSNATSFNHPLDKWVFNDSLLSMNGMFAGASSFNQPLNDWDIKNVYDFTGMFLNATSFNQPLDKWKFRTELGKGFLRDNFPYNVLVWYETLDSGFAFEFMFYNATSFNQNINSWAKQWKQNFKRTNVVITKMFAHASNYNQPMDEWGTLPGDTSEIFITPLDSLFYNASSFNQPIDNWEIGLEAKKGFNATANETFYGATHFNQPLGSWDMSMVKSLRNIFKDAVSFNQDLSQWNLGNLYPTDQIGFTNSGMSCENYSKTIHGWAYSPKVAWGVVVRAEGLKYSPKIDTFDILKARGILMDTTIKAKWNWKFIGDTLIGDNCKPKSASIHQQTSLQSVQIYPNPVSHTLYLANLPIGVDIAVFDVMGRKVFSSSVQQSNFKINTESWSQGVYLVQLNYQGERWMEKVVK